jgi:hypothetical protein
MERCVDTQIGVHVVALRQELRKEAAGITLRSNAQPPILDTLIMIGQ